MLYIPKGFVENTKNYRNQLYNDFANQNVNNNNLKNSQAYKPNNIDENTYEQWLNNILTGNLDYERNLEYLAKEQEFNAMEAQKNRDFQLMMSNTAFQRQAEDLEQAGFNPALITGLSGATTPVGSSATSTSKVSQNTGESYTQLLKQMTANQTATLNQVIGTLGQITSAFINAKAQENKQKSYNDTWQKVAMMYKFGVIS